MGNAVNTFFNKAAECVYKAPHSEHPSQTPLNHNFYAHTRPSRPDMAGSQPLSETESRLKAIYEKASIPNPREREFTESFEKHREKHVERTAIRTEGYAHFNKNYPRNYDFYKEVGRMYEGEYAKYRERYYDVQFIRKEEEKYYQERGVFGMLWDMAKQVFRNKEYRDRNMYDQYYESNYG
jgi:hypothetical protein